jgi:hypothetical protein
VAKSRTKQNKDKVRNNFYAEIGSIGGSIGGKLGKTGGFMQITIELDQLVHLAANEVKGYKYLGEEPTGLVYLNMTTNEVQIFKNNKLVEHKHFSLKDYLLSSQAGQCPLA